MSASPTALTESALVTRLRAAGCVFAEDEARLLLAAAETPAALAEMVDRRVLGLPLEHILGWVEFYGLRVEVDQGVFVPRRRSEFLVQEAAALAEPGAVVLDLCCGSGALGVALASVVPGIELHAADIEPAAVLCARRNVEGLGARLGRAEHVGQAGHAGHAGHVGHAGQAGQAGHAGHVYQGDLYAPLPAILRARVDILMANTPYVPTDAIGLMPPEARFHEPHVTLDGGADGLDVQRRVAAAATEWLAPGGHLLVETGESQAATTAAFFASNGLDVRIATSEEFYATVVIGTRPV
ncbi:putative protein N(5)-glutamine methyltransferase [Leifsonia kafniensis]|uniref:Methyltransferase small domain-containing protein n=1 Tax=Leifsonia kafniensis TaxID=475957 RepID=A0ABP7K3K7_9MICO